MLKTALILIVLVAVVAVSGGSFPPNAKSNVLLRVVTPQEMDEFLKQNPEAQQLDRQISPEARIAGQVRVLVTYTLGARASGDGIVGYDSGKNTWDRPNDVTLTINYPSSGTGAIITYMKIEVNQSNNLGRAFVNSGGVGYRYITVIVEGQSTTYFNWSHNIYGK